MIAEVGQFALALALAFSIVLAVYPLWGAYKGHSGAMLLARPLAYGQFLFTAIAYAALTWAFVVNDFSVAYVAANSNTQLPLAYRITAVWGSHEGSFLLWMLMRLLDCGGSDVLTADAGDDDGAGAGDTRAH